MRLNDKELENRALWVEKGYKLPEYDRGKIRKNTHKAPVWVHFGAGNLFRAFQAKALQEVLNMGETDKGIVVAEGFDYEIIDRVFKPCDNLGISVTLRTDRSVEKEVVGSVTEALKLDREDTEDYGRLTEIFRSDSLQMASFTITEKGYCLTNSEGQLLPQVQKDMEAGPKHAQSYMGKVCALLYERYCSGEKPISMVSMDNCSHNGDRLCEAVCSFAEEWEKRELIQKGFSDYIRNREKTAFPWTMIDKITPRPDDTVGDMLREDGLKQTETIVTGKNTYTAVFVNAEECRYLVVEDAFPAGRPPLEKAGIIFTTRDTVEKAERMKVCTCLNPLHTALAVFGCLLGYQLIYEEMENRDLKRLIERIGYQEGLPVVVHPGILEPKEFLDQVIYTRLPNPFIPDSPQRIATDTSQKLSIRFGETIKAYEKDPDKNAGDLEGIPLVFAGWLRYLLGIDDCGKPMKLSPDPLIEELCPKLAGIRLGGKSQARDLMDLNGVREILKRQDIFGVDLYEAGLGEKVEQFFEIMIAGPHAVDKTLKDMEW